MNHSNTVLTYVFWIYQIYQSSIQTKCGISSDVTKPAAAAITTAVGLSSCGRQMNDWC